MAFGTPIKYILFVLFVLLILFNNALTQVSYTTDGDGSWDVAANWNPDGVPGDGDDVTISNNITLASNVQIDGIVIDAGGSLDLNGFDLINDQATSVSGTLILGSGSHIFISAITITTTGTLTANSSSNSLSRNLTFDAASTFNEGTATWIFSENIAYTVEMGTSRAFDKIEHLTSSNVSVRTLTFAGGTATINTSFTRSGRSQGTIGTLAYNSADLIYAPSGAAMTVDTDEWPTTNPPDNITYSGSTSLTLSADRKITGTFTLNQSAGTFIISGGNTLTVNGTLQRNTSGTIGLSGAVSYAAVGSNLVYNSGANTTIGAEWPTTNSPENVAMTLTGSSTLSSIGDFDVTIAQDLTINVGTLDLNNGTLTVSGAVTGSNISGTATIDPASTLLLGNGGGTNQDQEISGILTLTLMEIDKSGGPGNTVTMTGSAALNFAGISSLTITAGTLDLNGGSRFTNAPNMLSLSSNSSLRTGGTTLSGITTLDVSSGLLIFNGSSPEIVPSASYGDISVDNSSAIGVTFGGDVTFSALSNLNVLAGRRLNLGGFNITHSASDI